MRQMQLIYTSRPFGFDDETLNGILFTARSRNSRDGITGALVCRHDMFLQLLEGPRDLVGNAFARILGDDRHVQVVLLSAADIQTRLFPTWEMRHDPYRSWMWSPEEVRAGAVADASVGDLRAVFDRIAAEPYDNSGDPI